MLGGFLCPWCRYYNALDARRCERCGQALPPPGVARVLHGLVGADLWATKLLVGLNIAVFALQLAAALSQKGDYLASMQASVTVRFGALVSGFEFDEPYRILAACFVHIGALHLALNMSALVQLGRVGESQVGGPRFVLTYVITGVIGFLASTWWYARTATFGMGGYSTTAGASGAIYGIAGLLIAGMAMRGDRRWREVLVQQLVYSFLLAFALHTNQAAHLGGLASGLALGVIFGRESRPWRHAVLVNSLAAVSLVACLVSLALPHGSKLWQTARKQEVERELRKSFREREIVLPE